MTAPITAMELDALLLSLKVGLVCTVASLPLGIAMGWLLARRQFAGKAVVEGLVQLPLVLPPVVTGYLLLVLFGRQGLIGRWLTEHLGVSFAFDWRGAALASAIVGFPLMVRAIRLAFDAVDPALEQASLTLGRGRWQTFLRISLPLALPGVLTGALLCFARSLGEFGATIVFAGNIEGVTRTLPLAIYTAIQTPEGEAAALRLVMLAVVVSFAAVLTSEWLSRRTSMRRSPTA